MKRTVSEVESFLQNYNGLGWKATHLLRNLPGGRLGKNWLEILDMSACECKEMPLARRIIERFANTQLDPLRHLPDIRALCYLCTISQECVCVG
jgi:hypothetical protein